MKRLFFAGLAAALAVGVSVHAGRQRGQQSFDGPFIGTNASADDAGEISFPAYTASAPLTRVRLTVDWHLGYAFRVENTTPNAWWNNAEVPNDNGYGYMPHFQSMTWLYNEAGQFASTWTPGVSVFMCTFELGAYDGTLDYVGPSGRTEIVPWNVCLQPSYYTTEVVDVTSPLLLSKFVDLDGDGLVTFRIGVVNSVPMVPGLDVPAADALSVGDVISDWEIVVRQVEYNP
jgi:hypothetical protein